MPYPSQIYFCGPSRLSSHTFFRRQLKFIGDTEEYFFLLLRQKRLQKRVSCVTWDSAKDAGTEAMERGGPPVGLHDVRKEKQTSQSERPGVRWELASNLNLLHRMPKQCPYLCAVPKALHQKAPSNKPAANSPCSRNPLSQETKLRSVTQKKD